MSFIIDQSYDKSTSECSSQCLQEKNCYFFDICETGSLTSCYLYDQHISSSVVVEIGACRRYELVK